MMHQELYGRAGKSKEGGGRVFSRPKAVVLSSLIKTLNPSFRKVSESHCVVPFAQLGTGDSRVTILTPFGSVSAWAKI